MLLDVDDLLPTKENKQRYEKEDIRACITGDRHVCDMEHLVRSIQSADQVPRVHVSTSLRTLAGIDSRSDGRSGTCRMAPPRSISREQTIPAHSNKMAWR